MSAFIEGTATTYTSYQTPASNVTDSQVSHPTITFQVNLETVNRQGHLVPNRTEAAGNETVAEADNIKNIRTIFIPGLVAAENVMGIGGVHGGDNLHSGGQFGGNGTRQGYLHHGDQFTVKGEKATYLKKLYVSSPAQPSDLLVIVSES